MKKTPWFNSNTRPARDSVYQIRYENDPRLAQYWCRWTGEYWCAGFEKFYDAEKHTQRGGIQGKEWRGLQGDGHSCQIGASTYLVEFGEGPDRPGDDE